MKQAMIEAVLAARAAKRPATVITRLGDGAQALIDGDEATGDLALPSGLGAAIEKALTDDRSTVIEHSDERYFIHVHNPPKRMIVVGAVHIAQFLVPMATLTGYAVTVVDPRGAFATGARFPGVDIAHAWPDEAMEELAPDSRTAVVTLTHDPKLDDPALAVALKSDCFYIGSLGSTRTHAGRLQRLRELGFNEMVLGRIHGPIGLNIGAVAPAEIAISIMAEITLALHGAKRAKAA